MYVILFLNVLGIQNKCSKIQQKLTVYKLVIPGYMIKQELKKFYSVKLEN
jgi:hypothetical protein